MSPPAPSPPLAVMYKVILIIACSALSGLSPPPDHHQPLPAQVIFDPGCVPTRTLPPLAVMYTVTLIMMSEQVMPFLAPAKTNYPPLGAKYPVPSGFPDHILQVHQSQLGKKEVSDPLVFLSDFCEVFRHLSPWTAPWTELSPQPLSTAPMVADVTQPNLNSSRPPDPDL